MEALHANCAAPIARKAVEYFPEVNPFPSRLSGKAWGILLATLYALLVISPLGIFVALHPASDRTFAGEAGVDCAIVGFTILAFQFVITARLRWIEAPFGLDVILTFHKAMALLATILLCAHPFLVASSEGWSLLTRLHARWYLWAGRVALFMLLVQVSGSLARRIMRLSYERWRRIHNLFALTILALGFAHSAAIGDDIRGSAQAVWGMLAFAALGCWVYHRLVRPWVLLRRCPFHVTAVVSEAPRVWTLILQLPGNRQFHFAPGQFQFLRLYGQGISSEEHPFTIASSPKWTRRITLTVKESGDFTSQISRVRPGDCATVHGPFGRFSHTLHPETEELIFVAAGVGITPLMSMLRYMRDCRDSQRVLLVYANRSLDDALFEEELTCMEAGTSPLLKVVHVLSSAPLWWSGEIGRLDTDQLLRLCGDIKGKAYYLCCPPPMTAALISGLRRTGVSPRHIHTDYFSL